VRLGQSYGRVACVILVDMDIKYLGHSSFKLKGKVGSVITDPFDPKMVGLDYLRVSAEMVTVSHNHGDHNQVSRVTGTTSRETPFVIDRRGEYEASGIGAIAIKSWHDDKEGSERGENLIFVFQIDGVVVAHLGDLGHTLSDKQIAKIGVVDVLLIPVGGEYTIGPSEAVKVIEQLSPAIVVPMHYKLPGMTVQFEKLASVDDFLEKSGFENARREDKLSLTKTNLPEETEVVVLGV